MSALTPTAELTAFLRLILPAEGFFCAFTKPGNDHRWASTHEELAKIILERDAEGDTVYHACASFKTPTRRTAENVHQIASLWTDTDPENGYGLGEMAKAITKFAQEEGLPVSAVVNSGHGAHSYWRLEKPLTREEWLPYANGFKERALERLKFDPARTADAASILRPPGTHNRKNGAIRDVTLLAQGANTISLSRLPKAKGRATKAPAVMPDLNPYDLPDYIKRIKILKGGIEPPDADANTIATNCAQMRAMRDTGGKLVEPLWHAAIGVLAFCRDGERITHEWSKGDPRYRHEETQERFDRKAALTGPTTCEHFCGLNPEGCKDCPFQAHVTTPVQLGRGQWPDPIVTYPEALELAKAITETVVTASPPAPKAKRQRNPVGAAASPAVSEAPGRTPEVALPKTDETEDGLVDLFGHSTREPEFTRDMLPDVIADFAFDAAERLGVEPAMVAIPAIVVGASALHDSVKIQPKVDDTEWTESARLWVASIARPGTKKTASLAAAIKPLRAIEREGRAEFKASWAKYEEAKDAHKKDGAAPKPIKPAEKRLIVSNTTMEKLAHILAIKGNDGGILWMRDELSGLIEDYDKYRNKSGSDRAAALELYEGNSLSIDRMKDEGSIDVANWSACKLGGIQPDKLKAMAPGLQTDGYFQRYLVYTGKNTLTDGKEVDRPPNEAALKAYSNTIKALVAINRRPPGIDAGVPDQSTSVRAPIKLSPEAQKYRKEVLVYSATVQMLPTTPPALATHFDKWSGAFARLLLTMHAIECVSKGNDIDPVVPGATAKKVRDLMLRFFLQHVVKIYADLFQPSDGVLDAQWIGGHILAHGLESITMRDIRRAYTKLEKNEHAIMAAMEQLALHGWITKMERLQGVKWTINQTVHVIYAARAAEEKARREAERRKVAERTATAAEVL